MKNVLSAGMLGGIVFVIWRFITNAVFRFRVSIDMKKIPEERQVYDILKENIVAPGRYVINPALTPERRFPDNEPVFSILYGGVGHEAAGTHMYLRFIVYFLASIIAAWMLSQASEKVLLSYYRKVLFFMAIGLLFAIFSDLVNSGIGNYPVNDAIKIAVNHVAAWTLVGLAVVWLIKPERTGIIDTK